MGATGIGGAGWSHHNLPGYDARRVCAKTGICAQLLFLRHGWKSGGADMLPCVTTLKYKGLETLDLEFKWCQRLGQDLQNCISGKDSFWAAVGARGRSTSVWMKVRTTQCSAEFLPRAFSTS